MMRWSFAALLVAGCGRFGFDAVSRAGDAGPGGAGDGPRDGAPDGLQLTIPLGAGIWLQMESDPTVSVVDSAGGHAIACSGACPTRVAGLHGNGYKFTNERLVLTYTANLSSAAGFTSAYWVKIDANPATVSGETCPFDLPFNSALGYDTIAMCIDAAATTVFDCETPGGVQDIFTGPALSLHAWHHIAMTWDGTTKKGYLDGVVVGQKALQIGSGTENFTFGGDLTYNLDGIMDDVVYYTRALNATEIGVLATP